MLVPDPVAEIVQKFDDPRDPIAHLPGALRYCNVLYRTQ